MRIGNLESINQKSFLGHVYFKLFGLPHYGSQVRFSIIKNLFKPSKNSIILDLGCGEGSYLNYASYLYGCSGIGVDRLNNRLKIASKINKHYHLNNLYVKKEADQFLSEYSGKKFDYILCIDVIEHIENPEKILKKCFKKLLPGGKLIISTPLTPKHKWLFNISECFDYGKDRHAVEGISEEQLTQIIKKIHAELLVKIQTFKILAQVLWEISEKIRKFKVAYCLIVPFFYLFAKLDNNLSPSDTRNGLIVVLEKR